MTLLYSVQRGSLRIRPKKAGEDALILLLKAEIAIQQPGYLFNPMDNRRMVPAAEELADLWIGVVFFGSQNIHHHLTRKRDRFRAVPR